MPHQILKLRQWTVDPAAGTLRHGDTERRLDNKTMAVLTYLASRPGEVISKAELIEAVWQGNAVSDDTLTGAISNLRKALGDSARDPEFVRTLPKRGYTLIVPVRRASASFVDERERGRGLRRAAAAGILALAIIAGLTALKPLLAPGPQPARQGPAEQLSEESPGANRARIAVLPFADRSNGADDPYLADSLAEALTTRLAQVDELHVLSWRTARQYRSRDLPLATLIAELELDAVLEGSVHAEGDRLRVYTRLVNVRDDGHLWAHSYDQPLGKLLEVETDLARQAEAAIREHLGLRTATLDATNPRGSLSPEAYRQYLKGRYFRHRETVDDLQRAVQHLQRAVQLDPRFAEAHAALAEAYFLQTEDKGLTRARGLDLGSTAAAEALRLNPELGAAHAVDAIVKFCLAWDFAGAERSFQAFLDRNPNDPVFLGWYLRFLNTTGRFDEALIQSQRIAELDPASYSKLGRIHTMILARQYEDALAHLVEAEALNPERHELQHLFGLIYDLLGRDDEAAASHLRALSRAGLGEEQVAELRQAYKDKGPHAIYRVLEQSTPTPVDRAALRARMGDREGALQLLVQAFKQGDRNLPWINVHPWFDEMRVEPGFVALLARLGLP